MSRRRVSPFIGESYLWWIAFSCDWSIDVLFMNHSCYIYWSAPPIPTNPNPQPLPHPNTLSPSEKIVQRTLHHYHSDSRLLLNWYMYFISKSNLWWINFSSDLGITGLGMTHVCYIPSSLPLLPTHQPPSHPPISCTSLIYTAPPPLKKFNSQQNSDIKISLKQIRSVPTTITYFMFKS